MGPMDRRQPGRWFMCEGGGREPSWVVVVVKSTRVPVRVRDHHKHVGYLPILGVAAGVLSLICFYFCVWLVQHWSRSRQIRGLRPPDSSSVRSVEGDSGSGGGDEDEKVRSGGGEGAKPMWNVGEVELVLMAGENVPTFLAHPALQLPPPTS